MFDNMRNDGRRDAAQTDRRIAWWLFFTLFLSYGYFHQGGGWSQNSRFDQVRAIVEKHQLAINDFWLYQVTPQGSGTPDLSRTPLPKEGESPDPIRLANTWDISYFQDTIVPNKPPGTVFLAVPAYALIYYTELLLRLNPGQWWTLTVNAYLTTAFSVGLLAAFGGLIFYFVSKRLFSEIPDWIHVAATLTFGFGTLILPFATLLFDHDVVASISLLAFYILLVERQGGFATLKSAMSFFLVGFLCGLMIMVNYSSLITGGCLFLYGIWISKNRSSFLLSGVAGLFLPLSLLIWYQINCFGAPWAIANTNQVAMFRSNDAIALGMLTLPKLTSMYALLFSDYRGLFFSSPVLSVALIGLVFMASQRRHWPELALFIAIFSGFLLMNSAFNFWQAGWTFGPRYLIPALPFLTLPLALIFQRARHLAIGLAVLSMCFMFTATAVDPQVPDTIANPFYDYILRLAQGERIVYKGIDIIGPLSANPIGVYEGWHHPAVAITHAQRAWHSFNLGELLWPESFWSLAPLMMILAIGIYGIRLTLIKTAASPIKITTVEELAEFRC